MRQKTALALSMDAGRNTVGAGSCSFLPVPCFSFLVGIADDRHFDGQLQQSHFAFGGKNHGAALKPEGETSTVGEGHAVFLGLRIKPGADDREGFVEGNNGDRQAADEGDDRLTVTATLNRFLQNLGIIDGGDNGIVQRFGNGVGAWLGAQQRHKGGGIEDGASHAPSHCDGLSGFPWKGLHWPAPAWRSRPALPQALCPAS
jgi:hypothetical protein